MTSLKKLIHKRGLIKGKLTRFEKALTPPGGEELDTASLQERFNNLAEIEKEFGDIQFQIAGARIDEAKPDLDDVLLLDDAETEQFERNFYRIKATAREKLSSVLTVAGRNSQSSGTGHRTSEARVKLPEIQLPKFGGNWEKWTEFKDSFESTIHQKVYLQNIEKFQYLRGVLFDEAAQVVSSLSTTAENYDVAWQLLKDKYDNKRLIMDSHLTELLNVPTQAKQGYAALNQLIIKVRSHTQALKVLGAPIDHWDMILIHIVASKLDYYTRSEWEKLVAAKSSDQTSTLKELLDYLSNRCLTLQIMNQGKSTSEASKQPAQKMEKKVSLASTSEANCAHCQGSHLVYKCESFNKLSTQEKWDEVKRLGLCSNCLRKGHISKFCIATNCKICSRNHNTVLHSEKTNSAPEKGTPSESTKINAPSVVAYHRLEAPLSTEASVAETQEESSAVLHCAQKPTQRVILSTAQVHVYDADNNVVVCRVLLDPGSQLNLVTNNFAKKLKFPYKKVNLPISGVSQSQVEAQHSVTIRFESMYYNFTSIQDYVILPRITERLPQVQMDISKFKIPEDILLADPEFSTPGEIDMLVGAGIFWKMLRSERILQRRGQPVLQKTLLGWIVGGEQVMSTQNQEKRVCNLSVVSSLEQKIEKLLNIDQFTKEEKLTLPDRDCEEQFRTTHTRNEVGRYKVTLPKNPDVKLGFSEKEATKRFYALENRLRKNPELRKAYTAFMDDYENSGHMSKICAWPVPDNKEIYYLPHHPVIREESMTTKLRVVFDGSAKTSLGTSLNDKLLAGPNLQQEIFDIIVRFRLYTYVITADITAMFRQIEVEESDRDLQRIIWRRENEPSTQVYSLNTVTYGTTCAPYLAMRCLRQLAEDDGAQYPQAAEALRRDFYMDDVLTGGNSIEEVTELQTQLSALLIGGRFELRKWRSNEPRTLSRLSEESKTNKLLVVDKHEAVKTLGLLWDSAEDVFQYNHKPKMIDKVTKRRILSDIAQIFDPLGLIGPALIQARMIMQELWMLQLDWDEEVPESIERTWRSHYNSLGKLNELRIPRNVNPGNSSSYISLHGFGDASERGYGACIYALSYDTQGNPHCSLLCSKSRVAPIKKTTLPRLELCAAFVLANLLDTVRDALKQKVKEVVLWSDSTIVLHWLRTPANQLKTFVANRVAEVQEKTINCIWRHVPSADNPADILSRGATMEQLINNKLWWHGPEWLSVKEEWPEQKIEKIDSIPEKKASAAVVLLLVNPMAETIQRFSTFKKLKRVIAYCHRFADNARGNKTSGPLTVNELERASTSIIRITQQEAFNEEFKDLKRKRDLNPRSKLVRLNPLLDNETLIRVGGRLRNADISEIQKHPIVLPNNHFITKLIMREMHIKMKHCGPEHLLNAVRSVYWPLSGRNEARKITRNCVTCFKYRPKTQEPMMGDLPESRVTGLNRPFDTAGVDYAGPLQLRESRRRGKIPITKAYIAVFTCFKTKAVHLELVSDLTTEAFLAALRRFTARRGICRTLYSDNGTNFVGAARELKEIYELLAKNEDEITTKLADKKITWKFIPPRAPHFGGLWEAAVKATKRHLYISLQGLIYTFEEYCTLLAEIEAILNSRPLTPLTSDPHDLTPLTPSHFLLGVSLSEPVTKDYKNVPDNHLTRWQHIQKIKQTFWSRWQKEYLHHLQLRTKWATGSENLQIGTLVLLMDDNAAPLYWSLGRVEEVHPGDDGIVRVATVKTANGLLKRPVRKLCALPLDT